MFPVRMATLFLSVCFIVLLVQLPTIEAYVTAVKSGAEVSVISSGFKTDSPDCRKDQKRGAQTSDCPHRCTAGSGLESHSGAERAKSRPGSNDRKHTQAKRQAPDSLGVSGNSPENTTGRSGQAPVYRERKKTGGRADGECGLGNEIIPEMLKIFKQEKVKATFFLDGSWLKKNPEMARQLVRRRA